MNITSKTKTAVGTISNTFSTLPIKAYCRFNDVLSRRIEASGGKESGGCGGGCGGCGCGGGSYHTYRTYSSGEFWFWFWVVIGVIAGLAFAGFLIWTGIHTSSQPHSHHHQYIRIYINGNSGSASTPSK